MSGWSHEEAKSHTIVERLFERCGSYSQDRTCVDSDLRSRVDWCERCLAATRIIELEDWIADLQSDLSASRNTKT